MSQRRIHSFVSLFISGLREALEWPWLRWMNRPQPVELIGGDDATGRLPADRKSRTRADKRVCAVVLPADLVLIRELILPDLAEPQKLEALVLSVERSSPFQSSDTVWGSRSQRLDDQRIAVRLALTSRQAIEHHLQTLSGRDASAVEVWAECDPPLVINGFGEGRRLARERSRRHLMLALSGAVLVGCLLLAVWPFMQIRQVVFEAQAAHAAMQQASARALADREALGRARDQAAAISAALQGQVRLLGLLESLSRAIPDSAHLTNLEVQGGLVKLTGQGPAASSIVDKLGASPQFASLRSTSAITRVGRDGAAERFSVEFQFQPSERLSETEPAQ